MNTERLKDVHDALERLAKATERAHHHAWKASQASIELDSALAALIAAGVYPNDSGMPSNKPLFELLASANKEATALAEIRSDESYQNECRVNELMQMMGLKKLPARRPKG